MPVAVQPSHSGKSVIRGTHIITILLFVLALGSGLVSWWITSSREQAEYPVLALNSLIRDVHTFHGVNGYFPVDLGELQQKLWSKQGRPEMRLTEANHSFAVANYYYLYAVSGPHEAHFWAVPLGRYRAKFSTYYVTVRNAEPVPVVWQGPALEYEQVKQIRGLMGDGDLINLGLTLQQAPTPTPQPQNAYQTQPRAQGQPTQSQPQRTQPPNDSPFRFKMN